MATIQPKNLMNKTQNLVSETNNGDETVWLKNVKHGTVVALRKKTAIRF